jgi:hypothetical protein
VPGRLRPPRAFDKNETELTGESIVRSTMDHESKHGGLIPPLFPGSPVQEGVRAASSTVLAPSRSLLIEIVRGNDFSAEKECRVGFGKHRSEAEKPLQTAHSQVDPTPKQRSRPSRFAAKTRKTPAPRLARQGFSGVASRPESPADRRQTSPRAMDCRIRKKSERLGRRRSVSLKLGRNLPLRWPLHGGPLDRRSNRGRSRGNGRGRR